MTDQTSVVAEEKVQVENETTSTKSPQVEVPTTEEQTTQEVSVDQDTSSESTDDSLAGSENWTAEQRRAFQEQRQEIKRLKEQVESKPSESAFAAFRPQSAPVSQPVKIESFTDPISGETNWDAFNAAQTKREQDLISQAQFVAQQTTQELMDENSARIKHPEEFKDKNFEQRVADRWFAAKMRGENPSVSQIADDEARLYSKAVSKAEKIGAEKAFTELSEKEKAGLSASGQTSQPSRQEASQEDIERLRVKTRGGDDDAITARISKIPWANK